MPLANNLTESNRRLAYLDAMGIQVWQPRHQPSLGESKTTSDNTHISNLDWPELAQCVAQCTACELHQTRRQTVFGTGNQYADWLIIGEAPGEMEDRQGEPFVGPAGQLLNQMLLSIGQQRSGVYIGNILKCRPPGNRDPKPEEAAQCRGYLQRQIELLQPKIILVVGRIAAHYLLDVTTPIGKLRGQVYSLDPFQIPLVVTYHPAYLLRSPLAKREAWKDLRLARQTFNERTA